MWPYIYKMWSFRDVDHMKIHNRSFKNPDESHIQGNNSTAKYVPCKCEAVSLLLGTATMHQAWSAGEVVPAFWVSWCYNNVWSLAHSSQRVKAQCPGVHLPTNTTEKVFCRHQGQVSHLLKKHLGQALHSPGMAAKTTATNGKSRICLVGAVYTDLHVKWFYVGATEEHERIVIIFTFVYLCTT